MEYPNLFLLNHDLATHKLTFLRDGQVVRTVFRRVMRELSSMLICEATRHLPLKSFSGATTLGTSYEGHLVAETKVVSISILRAGLVMEEAFFDLLPFARSGHVGIWHDYDKNEIHNYMAFLPTVPVLDDDVFFILDGLIGTSESVKLVVNALLASGVRGQQIRIVTLAVAEQGLAAFYAEEAYQDVKIYAVDIERAIDERGKPAFTIDKLSDRIFGTGDY